MQYAGIIAMGGMLDFCHWVYGYVCFLAVPTETVKYFCTDFFYPLPNSWWWWTVTFTCKWSNRIVIQSWQNYMLLQWKQTKLFSQWYHICCKCLYLRGETFLLINYLFGVLMRSVTCLALKSHSKIHRDITKLWTLRGWFAKNQ